MNAPIPPIDFIKHADAETALADVAMRLRAGTIIPYLGPGLAATLKPAAPMMRPRSSSSNTRPTSLRVRA